MGLSADLFRAEAGPTASSQLDEGARLELDDLLTGLIDRGVWQTIQTDPDRNRQVQAMIDEANTKYDPNLVAQYFKENMQDFAGDESNMSYDEFVANWLN